MFPDPSSYHAEYMLHFSLVMLIMAKKEKKSVGKCNFPLSGSLIEETSVQITREAVKMPVVRQSRQGHKYRTLFSK